MNAKIFFRTGWSSPIWEQVPDCPWRIYTSYNIRGECKAEDCRCEDYDKILLHQ